MTTWTDGNTAPTKRQPCAPGLHRTVSLSDTQFPTGQVCTLCGEVFPYVFELNLPKNITIVEPADEAPAAPAPDAGVQP